jgi:hypothetical protein
MLAGESKVIRRSNGRGARACRTAGGKTAEAWERWTVVMFGDIYVLWRRPEQCDAGNAGAEEA